MKVPVNMKLSPLFHPFSKGFQSIVAHRTWSCAATGWTLCAFVLPIVRRITGVRHYKDTMPSACLNSGHFNGLFMNLQA